MHNSLKGLVGLIINPNQILKETASVFKKTGIDTKLMVEGVDRQHPYYFLTMAKDLSKNQFSSSQMDDFSLRGEFDLGGNKLVTSCIAAPKFFSNHEAQIPLLTALIILAIAVFFAYYYSGHTAEKVFKVYPQKNNLY